MRKLGVLLFVVAVVACAREERAPDPPAASSDIATPSTGTAGARFDPKGAQATAPPRTIALLQQDVQVTLEDGRIGMPATLTAAQFTFNITNTGSREHSFEIEGEGIEKALDRPLQPGQSYKLVADLRAGTYRVYCPVADHEERGMTLPLVVQEPVAELSQ